MEQLIKNLSLLCVLSPLLGALIAGLGGRRVGRRGAHFFTILLMCVSLGSAITLAVYVLGMGYTFNGTIYTWGESGSFQFNIGFLIDQLTVYMMLVVTFVSTVVHIYSMGYMAHDDGDQRFFSYVSGFTFMMLMLITGNNFLQLFFGWEGVGLVSYLLIGFWFTKDSAATGGFKAFMVNRVGDLGFLLGIAAVIEYVGSVDYETVFQAVHSHLWPDHIMLSIFPGTHWSVISVMCILLFVGAMGKSAQVPLHVWLPESMEGPTPISALIHAATMVTAGIYMVARLSPMFEYSQVALSVVLVVGATGALFTGFLAFVCYDLKKIIAYSTMSQLGYMMAANGASAFSAAIFHLSTHACFKACLFLSAGSVLVAMHEERDIRRMGQLRRYLPVTYVAFLFGALALSAIPPFSGFYSKDAIIDAVHMSMIPGSTYAYWCLLLGAFVTAFYIFRAFFMAFHGEDNIAKKLKGHVSERFWSIKIALIALAIPSLIVGGILAKMILYSHPALLGSSVFMLPQYDVLRAMALHYEGPWWSALKAFIEAPIWFALSGIVMAWVCVIRYPEFPAWLQKKLSWIQYILVEQYGLDHFNHFVFVTGGSYLWDFLYKRVDMAIFDSFMVDGSGKSVRYASRWVRLLQSGFLSHYLFCMLLSVLICLMWLTF